MASAKSILLVDDDDDIADLLDLHLSDEGYDVEIVSDGDTGLDRALNGQHDLSRAAIEHYKRAPMSVGALPDSSQIDVPPCLTEPSESPPRTSAPN